MEIQEWVIFICCNDSDFTGDLVNFADRTFGQVIFAGIVVDTQWKYPRGCGIVIFSDPNNYRNAIQQKFVTLNVENKDHKNGNAKHVCANTLLNRK